jgi:hypothetical protein
MSVVYEGLPGVQKIEIEWSNSLDIRQDEILFTS